MKRHPIISPELSDFLQKSVCSYVTRESVCLAGWFFMMRIKTRASSKLSKCPTPEIHARPGSLVFKHCLFLAVTVSMVHTDPVQKASHKTCGFKIA